MKQFLDLMKRAIDEGSVRDNRTGISDSFVPGDMMKFDLAQGFPIMTTRRAAWKSSVGEMIAFIGAKKNAADFRALKCKFWDKNANSDGVDPQGNTVPNAWLTNPLRKGEDDLGNLYGHQWRFQTKDDGTNFDQFADAIRQIQETPNSRRIVVSGWMPQNFNQMALPPCHVLHQWMVDVKKKELHLNMFIRSNDLFLGAPANIIEYAWLLEVVAHATGYTPRWFTYFVGDAHVYSDAVDAAQEQMQREPLALPKLKILKPYDGSVSVMEWLENLHPDDFDMDCYIHHPPLNSPMPAMAV